MGVAVSSWVPVQWHAWHQPVGISLWANSGGEELMGDDWKISISNECPGGKEM